MVVLNDMDRFHLVCDVIDRVPGLATSAVEIRRAMVDKHGEHKRYVVQHGQDMPEILDWRWAARNGSVASLGDTGADNG